MGSKSILLGIILCFGTGSHALDWDPIPGTPGAQGGTGSWTLSPTNLNWLNGSNNIPWTNDSPATFGGTGGTVTVDDSFGGVAVSSLQFDTAGYQLTGDAISLTSGATLVTNADVTIQNALLGTGTLTKTGSGTVSWNSIASFGGNVQIDGGGLSIFGEKGPTIVLNKPNQLRGAGSVSFAGGDAYGFFSTSSFVPGVELAAGNPGLSGQVSINGVLTASAAHALGTGAVSVINALNLNAPDASSGPITVSGDHIAGFIHGIGILNYNANQAAGGVNPVLVNGTLRIGPDVTSVGNDRFAVAPGAAIVINNATPGLLTRGGNLTLAPGALVSYGNGSENAAIANLGTAQDLWAGVGDGDPGSDEFSPMKVTVGPGTPFRGLIGGDIGFKNFPRIHGTLFYGTVTATGDFEAQNFYFGGTANSATPVTMTARDVTFFGGQLNNVTIKVPAGQGITIVDQNGDLRAAGLDLEAGSSVFITEVDPNHLATPAVIPAPSGSGSVQQIGNGVIVRVETGATATFNGTMSASIEKQGGGTWVLGPGATLDSNSKPLVVSEGTLSINAANVIKSTVSVAGGSLNLEVPNALQTQANVLKGGRLNYDANGGAGGISPVAVSTTDLTGPASAVSIGAAVTSVVGDQFSIGAGSAVILHAARPGLLTRVDPSNPAIGQNITLARGTIVAADANGILTSGTIANLGNNNDLFYGVAANFNDLSDNIVVGISGGTTPWMGISSDKGNQFGDGFGASSRVYSGTLTAANDFIVQQVSFTGTIIAAKPIRAIIRHDAEFYVGSDLHNVTVYVEPGAVLQRAFGLESADALDVAATGLVRVIDSDRQGLTPVSLSIKSLQGEGTINSSARAGGTFTIGLGDADSNFSGNIVWPSTGMIEKVGSGVLTLGGEVRGYTFNGDPAPANLTISGGRVDFSAPIVLDGGNVTLAANTTLNLLGFAQNLRLSGAGDVNLGGATLTAYLGSESTSFAGRIHGNGGVVITGGAASSSNDYAGPLTITGPFLLTGNGAFPNVSQVFLRTGGILEINNSAPAGATAAPLPAGPVGANAPVELDGGTLRLVGAAGQPATQTFGIVTPRAGASTIEAVSGAGSSATLSFDSLGPRSVGATVDFKGSPLGAQNKILLGNQTPGFIGGWAVANSVDFARYDPAKGVIPFAAADYSSNPLVSGTHLKLTSSPATLGNSSFQTINLAADSAAINFFQNPFTTIDVTRGGIIKSGPFPATVATSPGANGILTSSSGDLIFHIEGGDLNLNSRVAGTTALTKSGSGTLVIGGEAGNTFTGATFVNAGELVLNKPLVNSTLPGDVVVNGGTLRLARDEQIADTATVTLNAGAFTLNGFNETIGSLVNNGGTFIVSSGATPAPTPAGGPQGAPAASLSGQVRTHDMSGNSTDHVQAGATFQINFPGSSGLTFSGGGTPVIDLAAASGGAAPGTLILNTDISAQGANTRAAITGGGIIDLNNAQRTFTVGNEAQLTLGVTIQNGDLVVKSGAGQLTFPSGASFAGTLDVNDGAFTVTDPQALTGTVGLGTAQLTLRYTLDTSTRDIAAPVSLAVSNDSTLTLDETSPDPLRPGTIHVQALQFTPASPGASSRLILKSPNHVALDVRTGLTLDGPGVLQVDAALTVSSNVSGAGGLTKDGPGLLTLAGLGNNTYQGATVVEGGVMELNQAPVGTGIPSGSAITGPSLTVLTGSQVRLLRSEQIIDTAAVTVTGIGAMLDLGGFNETVASLLVQGRAVVSTGGGTLIAPRITLASGGQLRMGTGAAASSTPDAGGRIGFSGRALKVTQLSTDNGTPANPGDDGLLDLTNNALIYDYTGASPMTSIRDALRDGRIMTSLKSGGGALGYAEASVLVGAAGQFAGQSVDSTAVIVQYTVAGDANLDGAVNFADLVAVAQHYGAGDATWNGGDFNYDGNVGFADLVAVAQHYGTGLPDSPIAGASAAFEADAAAAFGSLPEPSGAGFLLIAAGVMLASRRFR